ncbi:transporter substrate-binding domain-containing protein [Undibacterium sp. LX40W]|uniref:Transporter substrate-binding domain-containing protein n=1 Tax=Undibacterium nitidum TaxID=2762298 RepID=A0A923KSE5_9BURK|nr:MULTISPECIES: transporter substrate-binding domain-containing protein [Undibacterium]MBC3881146.1 transporter substrate-binding domain-containing protein [Undibacterium nitidum]MBC3890121.1 transporter substrate-binding domain-containing protein [Undibacterium sp. LX40W]
MFALRLLLISIFVCLLSPSSVSAQVLKAYTEEWPPYNFIRDNKLVGVSTDILKAVCADTELKCDMQLVPWTRAYKTVLETPDTMIYTISRIPLREKQFVWIGPILPRSMWIFARADVAAKIHTLKDIANFRIGAIREEASLSELLEAGVPSSSIQIFNTNTDEMRMLKAGKIDIVANTEIGMQQNQKTFGIPDKAMKRMMKLNDGAALYFGMNINSNKDLVAKLQASVDKMKREGKIDAIVQQYTKAK